MIKESNSDMLVRIIGSISSYERKTTVGSAADRPEVISFVAVAAAVNLAARLTEKAT